MYDTNNGHKQYKKEQKRVNNGMGAATAMANCPEGEGILGICGWGCAAGTLEPLTYNRASSAEFCYPILE